MKKLLIICHTIIIVAFASCNKESIIEGYNTNATEVVVNKTYPLSISNMNQFLIQVDNITLRFDVQNLASRGLTTTTAYNNTDSVRFSRIFIGSAGYMAVQNNCTAKFSSGQDLSLATYSQANPFVILFSKKSSSFTSPFTSIYSSFFYEKTIQPSFSLNSDAYVAFKIKATPNGADNSFYFGWIRIIVGQNEITFDKVAYRLNNALKAGQIKD